jgi:hypothetical protein
VFLRGSVLGSLFFLLYLNDLSNIIADLSYPFFFLQMTQSIIIANSSPSEFKVYINSIIKNISDWFRVNSSSLNFDKTYFLQFMIKHNSEININISCDNKWIKEIKNTRFLGLDIASSLSWKDHNDHLMFKLGIACCAVRNVKHFMSQDTIRIV